MSHPTLSCSGPKRTYYPSTPPCLPHPPSQSVTKFHQLYSTHIPIAVPVVRADMFLLDSFHSHLHRGLCHMPLLETHQGIFMALRTNSKCLDVAFWGLHSWWLCPSWHCPPAGLPAAGSNAGPFPQAFCGSLPPRIQSLPVVTSS